MQDSKSSKRGITPYDLRWPDTPEFTRVAAVFATDAIDNMLRSVWGGYAIFSNKFLSSIDISQADEELERSITQSLEPCIRDCLSGDESYDVLHGPYEFATRSPAPAQPPEYDIAFYLKANMRVMWPLEAKIMRTPANVSPYVKDINNEFLTGRYAPFSKSAGMLGYLLSGKVSEVPAKIEKKLETNLNPHEKFHPEYPHHVSIHHRSLSNPSWISGEFQCHHMIMDIG